MSKETNRLGLVFNIQLLFFVLIGIILIALGNAISLTFWKIDVGEAMAHIGFLVLIIGTLHNLYEFRLRKEFQREIASSVLGNTNIHRDGIIDTIQNGKEIPDDYFTIAEKFIIGVGYNTRFVQTHSNAIVERSRKGKTTTLIHYLSNGIAAQYLIDTKTGSKSLNQTLGQLRALIDKNKSINNEFVKFIAIDSILRYNFIYTELFIWLKFYCNSNGIKSTLPAIKLNCGTPFYNFFETDILTLIDDNKHLPNLLSTN